MSEFTHKHILNKPSMLLSSFLCHRVLLDVVLLRGVVCDSVELDSVLLHSVLQADSRDDVSQ